MTLREIVVGYQVCGVCGGGGCGRCKGDGETAVYEWVEMDEPTDDDSPAVQA